jgi:hypothetical protein
LVADPGPETEPARDRPGAVGPLELGRGDLDRCPVPACRWATGREGGRGGGGGGGGGEGEGKIGALEIGALAPTGTVTVRPLQTAWPFSPGLVPGLTRRRIPHPPFPSSRNMHNNGCDGHGEAYAGCPTGSRSPAPGVSNLHPPWWGTYPLHPNPRIGAREQARPWAPGCTRSTLGCSREIWEVPRSPVQPRCGRGWRWEGEGRGTSPASTGCHQRSTDYEGSVSSRAVGAAGKRERQGPLSGSAIPTAAQSARCWPAVPGLCYPIAHII